MASGLPANRSRKLASLSQRVLRLPLLGDVAQKRAEDHRALELDGRDRQLHGKLRAVPAQGAELQTPVECRAVSRLAEAREALFVGLPVSGRDDNLGEPSTKDVLRWPTEQLLGLGVPAEDQPFDIDGDDGIERAREGQPAALFTLVQGLLRISKLRGDAFGPRSEEHTSELQSLTNLVCRLLLEKKNTTKHRRTMTPDIAHKRTPRDTDIR